MARNEKRGRRRRVRPEDELTVRIQAAARARGGPAASEERDMMVAMVVVRAIDRARELAAVEGAGLGLRRALTAAAKPMTAYVDRHLAQQRRVRRKKA